MKSKGSFNSVQQDRNIVKQETVFDLKQKDETLLRFLKCAGYNLPKAEEMLRKSIKWYRDNNVASYLHWKPPQPVADDYTFECIGEDYDGHSVIYMPIGAWHTKKIMELGYREESLHFRFYLLEKIMESVRKTKKSKFVMIMDMEGLTYRKCLHYDTIHFLGIAFKDFEDYYPERLRSCFIINAPWAFTYMYSALKHVFSSRTLNKAKIFDSDGSVWKPLLLEKIPPNILQKVWNSAMCFESDSD